MRIKISTDSTSDIPKSLQQELAIKVLPLPIVLDDRQWLDGVDITTEEFYKVLEEEDGLPMSAAASPAVYTELFEECFKEGITDLIHFSINSKGSSTYHNGLLAREWFYEAHPEAQGKFNIHLVDTLAYSMCYGMAVIKAAKMANEGAGVDEILAEAQDWLDHQKGVFVPGTLKFVKKSGRVSAASAFVGDALGLRPIISFDKGESVVLGKVRGEDKSMKEVVERCKKERKAGAPYAVIVGNNAAANEKFIEMVKSEIDEGPEIIFNVGCIISINTGPNMIGLIYRT
ncbi:MAG: DegV family protein [Ruminococcus sp.]